MSPLRHILFAGPLVLWRTDGLLIAFPVVAYGFTAHQFLFNIYATLRVPSVKRMVGVVQNVRTAPSSAAMPSCQAMMYMHMHIAQTLCNSARASAIITVGSSSTWGALMSPSVGVKTSAS